MRIVMTYENLLPARQADAEQFLRTADALAQQGNEVDFVVPRNPDYPDFDHLALQQHYGLSTRFNLIHLPSQHRFIGYQHAAHAWQVCRWLKGQHYDLVYTRNLSMLAALLQAGHTAVYEHFRPWGDQIPPLQPLLRYLLQQPSCLGAILHSHFAQASYVRLGIATQRLQVIHNGYDPALLLPYRSRTEARQQLHLPRNKKLVMYTGRINQRKGLESLLAMAKAMPALYFVLVGSYGQGPIEAQATGLSNVQVIPWQPFEKLSDFLYAADVLMIPPSAQPLIKHGNTVLPLKLFLYLAARRPIFAPANPDTSELLQHGINAELCSPGNIKTAVQALQGLLDDPARQAKLVQGATKTAEGLTWAHRAQRIQDFLRQRLNAKTARRPSNQPSPPTQPAIMWLGDSARWLLRGVSKGQWIMPPAHIYIDTININMANHKEIQEPTMR